MLNRLPSWGIRLWKSARGGASLSDSAIPSAAPAAIARELAGKPIACLPPSNPPKQHARYLVGREVMLHVYGTKAHPALPHSVPDRLKLQARFTDPGVPRLLRIAFTPERIWLLEDGLHGAPLRAPLAGQDLQGTIELLGRLAQMQGPALHTTPFWEHHRQDSIAAAPPSLRRDIEAAWDELADVKAAPLHGDVRPKNLIKGPHGIGLVDWEGFWRHGLPDHDIAYLLTMNARQGLDPIVADALAGRPHRCRELLTGALMRCGYKRETLQPALLVMAALWSLGEARREQLRPGSGRSTRFRDLLAARPGT